MRVRLIDKRSTVGKIEALYNANLARGYSARAALLLATGTLVRKRIIKVPQWALKNEGENV